MSRPGWNLQCVAVLDGNRKVIGVGRGGYPVRPEDAGQGVIAVRGIAPKGSDTYEMYAKFRESDAMYLLPAPAARAN